MFVVDENKAFISIVIVVVGYMLEVGFSEGCRFSLEKE